MNPLSAIRSLAGAEALPAPLPKVGSQPLAPTPIPFSELKDLGASGPLQLSPTGESSPSFGNLLGRLVTEVNDKQVHANEAVKGLISGQNVSLHQAVIATEEANVSFQLMVEVRNRLLDAYQELMRMQI
jgi:flagellar hook-basal body complex protein FliE